jgi:hypothetical protein
LGAVRYGHKALKYGQYPAPLFLAVKSVSIFGRRPAKNIADISAMVPATLSPGTAQKEKPAGVTGGLLNIVD